MAHISLALVKVCIHLATKMFFKVLSGKFFCKSEAMFWQLNPGHQKKENLYFSLEGDLEFFYPKLQQLKAS